MIKLIATDLDGTFLDSKKNKPADFPEVFKEIKRRDQEVHTIWKREIFLPRLLPNGVL